MLKTKSISKHTPSKEVIFTVESLKNSRNLATYCTSRAISLIEFK